MRSSRSSNTFVWREQASHMGPCLRQLRLDRARGAVFPWGRARLLPIAETRISPPLNRSPPQARLAEVDDRPTEIKGRPIGFPNPAPSGKCAQKRLLDDLLGLRRVSQQQP